MVLIIMARATPVLGKAVNKEVSGSNTTSDTKKLNTRMTDYQHANLTRVATSSALRTSSNMSRMLTGLEESEI